MTIEQMWEDILKKAGWEIKYCQDKGCCELYKIEHTHWYSPDGKRSKDLHPITLDNVFKYGAPLCEYIEIKYTPKLKNKSVKAQKLWNSEPCYAQHDNIKIALVTAIHKAVVK